MAHCYQQHASPARIATTGEVVALEKLLHQTLWKFLSGFQRGGRGMEGVGGGERTRGQPRGVSPALHRRTVVAQVKQCHVHSIMQRKRQQAACPVFICFIITRARECACVIAAELEQTWFAFAAGTACGCRSCGWLSRCWCSAACAWKLEAQEEAKQWLHPIR